MHPTWGLEGAPSAGPCPASTGGLPTGPAACCPQGWGLQPQQARKEVRLLQPRGSGGGRGQWGSQRWFDLS